MNSVVLQVNDLRFLDNGPYSFAVREHEVFGLSGKSGVGKTQLLRALVETINYNGSILYKESPPEKYSPSQWRRMIGLVPAESQWWHESVAEHFAEEVSQKLLQSYIVGLGFDVDILSWRIERLSTGERQRLALARALVLNPAVVLLDEPCSALDVNSTERVEKLLLSYKEKPDTALVWVSHDDDQLQRVASCCHQVHHNSLEARWQHH
jgi:putative ABC transport system ATP-binding protein